MDQPPSWNRYTREFTRILEGFRYTHGLRELFADWLEIAAAAIHQEPYHLGLIPQDSAWQEIEAHYLNAIQRYQPKELDAFAQLLGITKLALGEAYGDFLGSVYMGLEISQKRSGEFFTPFPVSVLMAGITLGDVSEHLKEKGFITLAEPACGGGGMLIAVARIMAEAGHDPGATMFFEATDISKLCFNMAYLQTAILGLSGIVRHGDTLRSEVWSSRFTPICRVFPWRTRRFLESLTAAPEEGTTAQKALPAAKDDLSDQMQAPDSPQRQDSNLLDDLAQAGKIYEQGRLF